MMKTEVTFLGLIALVAVLVPEIEALPGQKCIDQAKNYATPALNWIKKEICSKCKVPYNPTKDFVMKNWVLLVANDLEGLLSGCKIQLPQDLSNLVNDCVQSCFKKLSTVPDVCKAQEKDIGDAKSCLMSKVLGYALTLSTKADSMCDCVLKANYITALGAGKKHSYKALGTQVTKNKKMCK